MIIGSFEKLEVGKRYGVDSDEYITDKYKVSHYNQPFLVLRESTKDEWIAECIKDNIPMPSLSLIRDAYFYEISID